MSQAILVTGADGQLGKELLRSPLPQGWQMVAVGREALDLSDLEAISDRVAGGHAGQKWAAVINGAAYTKVDKAESEPVQAWQVNALAPAAFGEACAKAGVPLVQVSTDYVFSGEKDGAWEVDDPVGPIGVYGASKLGGEVAVRASGARHVILRTAWVVSAHGHNFVKTMLRLGSMHDALQIVDDQCGSPTAAADLAKTLIKVAESLATNKASPIGTFHFSNAGATTWAGFAAEIFRQSAQRGGPTAAVEPIRTIDYPTPARRPANSLLSSAAIGQAYGIVPRPWVEALGEVLDELIGAQK